LKFPHWGGDKNAGRLVSQHERRRNLHSNIRGRGHRPAKWAGQFDRGRTPITQIGFMLQVNRAKTPPATPQTAIFVSNDIGATWTQVFGAAQSGGTIQGANQNGHKDCAWPWRCDRRGGRQFGDGQGDRTVFGREIRARPGHSFRRRPSTMAVRRPSIFAIAIDPKQYKLSLRVGRRNCGPPIYGDGLSKSTLIHWQSAASPMGIRVMVRRFHADARAITFDANGRLILTSDGTIFARTNPQNDAGVWTRLSGNISAFESYAVGYDAVGQAA